MTDNQKLENYHATVEALKRHLPNLERTCQDEQIPAYKRTENFAAVTMGRLIQSILTYQPN